MFFFAVDSAPPPVRPIRPLGFFHRKEIPLPSDLFFRLKTATMPFHDFAEREGPMARLLIETVTLKEYHHVLQRLHGFLDAAEPRAVDGLKGVVDEAERDRLRRLPDLTRDLNFFGLSPVPPSVPPAGPGESAGPPPLDRPARALGWFYLSEGSRLGGRVLSRALNERLGLEPETGLAYFSSRGENPGRRWREFRRLAGGAVATPGAEREMIQAARQCFERLNHWLSDPSRP